MTKLADNLAALREPEYLKLFLGQASSVIGSMFRIVALPFAVLAIGGSATDIGMVEAAGLIPLTLLVLFGGVWADRLPRRTVMLVADAVRTVLQLTAAALLVAGVAEVWQLAVLQVGMGVCEAFFWPAYTGLVPEVVSPPRLQQANALQGLVSSGSVTLGAILAGMLVAAIGPGWALGVDGLSYLVSAGFLLRLRPAGYLGRRAAKRATAGPDRGIAREDADADELDQDNAHSMFRDLAEGWREFTGHTWIWVMTAGSALFLFAIDGPIQVLGPVVARDVYDGARTWGFTSAAMGLGQIAGGLLVLSWRPRRPILVIAAGMSVTAVPVALLGAGGAGLDALRGHGRRGRRVGSLRALLADVHAARGGPVDDLAGRLLRLLRPAGVLPGGAGARGAARRRVRSLGGAVGGRRRRHSRERVPALVARRACAEGHGAA